MNSVVNACCVGGGPVRIEANTRSPAAAAGIDKTGVIASIIIAVVVSLLLIIVVVGLVLYCRLLLLPYSLFD